MYSNIFYNGNEKHGWEKGDLLLKQFAEALTQINKSDLVFRLYGDNFVILNKEHLDTFEENLEILNKLK